MRFRSERWADVEAELMPLALRHWREMPFDERLPVAPQPGWYADVDSNGKLDVVTARADGQLVGYFITFLSRHPHYDLLVGTMDVYYLVPEERKASAGIQLFAAMLESLKARGVQYSLTTSRLDRDKNAAPILKYFGYKPARIIHEKRL